LPEEGPEEGPQEKPTINAFDILMSKKSISPALKTSKVITKKIQLHNDIVAYLDMGFQTEDQANTLVKIMTDTIWYLDPHVDTIAQRFSAFPLNFKKFLKYNKPEIHKHAPKSIVNSELIQQTLHLETFLEQPWLSMDKYSQLKQDLDDLSLFMTSYSTYLDEKRVQTANAHSRTEQTTFENVVTAINPQMVQKVDIC